MDATVTGACPVSRFGMSGVEPSASAGAALLMCLRYCRNDRIIP